MSTTTRTRLSPAQRREQLLDLGVRLLAVRSLDEISIDLLAEEAGISRGLLYHYFGNKVAFREAVVRHAADDLIAQTAPPPGGEPLERLLVSVAAYVDYVTANFEGYVSLVKGAAGGSETLRGIYEEVREALSERIFTELDSSGDAHGELILDTPRNRLIVRGWAAMCEEVVIAWRTDPGDITRDDVLALITGALPALVEAVPPRG